MWPKEYDKSDGILLPILGLKDTVAPLSLFSLSLIALCEGSQLSHHKKKPIWKGTEALYQELCEYPILERGPPAPVNPLGDCSPIQQLDCKLMRDPKP